MSETLTDAALVAGEEAPPVGDDAPLQGGSEVDTGSGSGHEEYVSKDRFNGLMSSFNKAQSELQAALSRVEALESDLNSRNAEPQEKQSLSDTSTLEQQVAQLSQMLMAERLENAKAKVLAEFPEAAPFADLIVANTPDDLRDMAQAIAERAKKAGLASVPASEGDKAESSAAAPEAPAAAAAPAAVPEAPEAPILGGGPAADAGAPTGAADSVAEAIKNKDFLGFLRAQRARQDADLALEDG